MPTALHRHEPIHFCLLKLHQVVEAKPDLHADTSTVAAHRSGIKRACVQGQFEDAADAAARLFVWLRYSSARKLTWQRNYNTQPRILGEAQARLTHAISEVQPCKLVLEQSAGTCDKPASLPECAAAEGTLYMTF